MMNINTNMITAIVPSLPPSINGVGDYAFLLAKELRAQHGLETQFIVADCQWSPSGVAEGFHSKYYSCDPQQLAGQLPDDGTVLLHYVNYAYQKRGCPIWLLRGLRQWKAQNARNRLVTMFHELYAFGPPWTSSFWLSPVHRMLAAQLCRLSDKCITSMQKYADRLTAWDRTKAGKIPALPVFSNIGEPTNVPPLAERKRRMVVFGGKALRTRAYTVSLEKLKAACSMLDIQEVIDVGPELGFSIPDLGVPFVAMGKLDSEEVQLIMLTSRFGFIDYFPGYLAKSGIFAVYCAHGLVQVSDGYNPSEADGVYNGELYLNTDVDLAGLTLEHLQSISNKALEWYQQHNLAKHAEIFASVLRRT